MVVCGHVCTRGGYRCCVCGKKGMCLQCAERERIGNSEKVKKGKGRNKMKGQGVRVGTGNTRDRYSAWYS